MEAAKNLAPIFPPRPNVVCGNCRGCGTNVNSGDDGACEDLNHAWHYYCAKRAEAELRGVR